MLTAKFLVFNRQCNIVNIMSAMHTIQFNRIHFVHLFRICTVCVLHCMHTIQATGASIHTQSAESRKKYYVLCDPTKRWPRLKWLKTNICGKCCMPYSHKEGILGEAIHIIAPHIYNTCARYKQYIMCMLYLKSYR